MCVCVCVCARARAQARVEGESASQEDKQYSVNSFFLFFLSCFLLSDMSSHVNNVVNQCFLSFQHVMSQDSDM